MHTPTPLPVRIITHNIRYAKTPPLFPGESPWRERLPGIIAQLRLLTAHHAAPLIFLQEVLHAQLLDILEGLNPPSYSSPSPAACTAGTAGAPCSPPSPIASIRPSSHESTFDSTPIQPTTPSYPAHRKPSWAHLGVGRDDGFTAGEFSPILYQPSIFAVTLSTTRWLSPDPTKPGSKYPGAGSPRLATIARLTHRASGFEFLAVCTHLDDQSAAARLFAAKTLLGYADRFGLVQPPDPDEAKGAKDSPSPRTQRLRIAKDAYRMPVILAGDLNSEPHEDAYLALTQPSKERVSPATDVSAGPLADVWTSVPPPRVGGYHYGPKETFTGFEDDLSELKRIDFVFARPVPAAEVKQREKNPFRIGGLLPRRDRSRHHRDEAVEVRGWWDVEGEGVMPNVFDDGVFLSDHRAVVADLLLRRD